jgi:hypothetical protein
MSDRPIRVQQRRTKGYKLPENTVSVTRGPGRKWGNPFTIADARDAGHRGTDAELAEYCVRVFRRWLAGGNQDWMGAESDNSRKVMLDHLPDLRGQNLACFCPLDQPCHADVLLDLANGRADG